MMPWFFWVVGTAAVVLLALGAGVNVVGALHTLHRFFLSVSFREM